MNSNAKIGLFGTGLDTYWGQFDGLLDELKGYQARIRDRMERDAGVQVADAGMVDSPARALEAASLFAREQVDLVGQPFDFALEVAFHLVVGFFQQRLLIGVLHDVSDALALGGLELLVQVV